MDLDLGQSVVYKVKINGEVYEMSAPRAKYVNNFRKKISNDEGNEIDHFIKFVVDHGLPKNVAEDLDVVQLNKLAQGLTGSDEKK